MRPWCGRTGAVTGVVDRRHESTSWIEAKELQTMASTLSRVDIDAQLPRPLQQGELGRISRFRVGVQLGIATAHDGPGHSSIQLCH